MASWKEVRRWAFGSESDAAIPVRIASVSGACHRCANAARKCLMSLDVYAGFLLATILIVIIPGPMVTLVIANSLTHGMRAGILNVLGGQVGLAISIALVALG